MKNHTNIFYDMSVFAINAVFNAVQTFVLNVENLSAFFTDKMSVYIRPTVETVFSTANVNFQQLSFFG